MVVSQRKKTRKQGGDRQQAEDERRVREGRRIEVSGVVGWKWRRGFSERKGESSAGTEKYCVFACPIGDQKNQIFRLDIVNTSACQSQGFPLCLFLFFFYLSKLFTHNPRGFTPLISESYPLWLSKTAGLQLLSRRRSFSHCFHGSPLRCLFLKRFPGTFSGCGDCIVKLKAYEKPIQVKIRGQKKGVCVIIEETWVTMKDLWQALRAGGGFISLLSTKSPPLRCTTYLLCSALSLLSIPHSLLEINAHPHRHRHI